MTRTTPGRRPGRISLGVAAAAAGAVAAAVLVVAPGSDAEAAPPDRGLHVSGRTLVDGNGERVVLRGPEHVVRWGDYEGSVPWGDVPWEGGANDVAGEEIDDIARTGANAVRLLGGTPQELEPLLRKAIVDHDMYVSIARVDWRHPQTIAAIKKYEKYVTLHIKGETVGTDEGAWRSQAVRDITEARKLGYTSPIEVFGTSYGQRLSAILNEGDAVAAADPLKNTVFGFQLYSELARDVGGSLDSAAGFGHPVMVGASRFQDGIDNGWGNTPDTYKQVWDGTGSRGLSSFYWAWGLGEHDLSSTGRFEDLTAIGRYVVDESPYALTKFAPKGAYLRNAPNGPTTAPPAEGPPPTEQPPPPTGQPAAGGPARSGTKALSVAPQGTWRNAFQFASVPTGTSYRATVHVRGSGAVQLRVHAGSWGADLGTTTCEATTGEWRACSVTFATGSNTQVTFRVTDQRAGGSLTVDDASLTPVAGGNDVLRNGSFEQPQGWLVEEPVFRITG